MGPELVRPSVAAGHSLAAVLGPGLAAKPRDRGQPESWPQVAGLGVKHGLELSSLETFLKVDPGRESISFREETAASGE